ncbi:MAG: dihydroorotate dehydrogenase electron transfer subunit [Erysipelotrichaceae bacterium]
MSKKIKKQLAIISNQKISHNTYEMILSSTENLPKMQAGQFINILLPNLSLRRPISICDCDNKTITIIYKVVGKGTAYLAELKDGELDVLIGLGNGYTIIDSKPLLVGGGVGIPPLYLLAKQLLKQGIKPKVILAFNSKSDLFYIDNFKALEIEVIVTTIDGSYGIKGLATTPLNELDYNYLYTCGPKAMLRALYNHTNISGQYSFEERMGCGFGACMGCSTKTNSSNKRICLEGPVLLKEDIVWTD